MNAKPEHVVSQLAFAKIIGKSPEWVRKLCEMGMPSTRTGRRDTAVRINTPDAIAWLLQQERMKFDTKDEDGGLAGANLQLRRNQAALAELELRERRGELRALSDYQRATVEAMTILRTQFESLPSRMASQLAGEADPAEVRQALAAEVRRVLTAAADALRDWSLAVAEGRDPPNP